MNTQQLRKPVLLGLVLNLACLLAAKAQNGNTNIWFGPGAGLNNWSTAPNWTNATTGTQSGLVGGDDVKMFSTGGTAQSNVDNVVDVNTTIGSLVYGSTNNATLHTTLINDGMVLSVTNTGGLSVGTLVDFGVGLSLTNTVTGANGTLVISNAAANIGINQANASANPSRATLDMSGLGTFQVTASRIAIGDAAFPGLPVAQHTGGNLILAKTNIISLSYSDTLANYRTAGKNYAILMSRNAGNNPGIVSGMQLGISNAFFLDSMDIGMDKSANNSTPAHGFIIFNPAFGANSPSAYFRVTNGATDPTSRITWWGVGDGNSSASSSNGGGGTNDFSLGRIDALINVLSLARDAANAADTFAGPHKGVFTFTSGIVDVNTLIAGNQSLETGTSTAASWGQMNVNGVNALLRVNSTLTLGNTTISTAAGLNTRGQLSINGGTVYASNIVVGAVSITNLVTINNGTLVISNALATNAAGLFTFNITNSTLGLKVTPDASTKALTKILVTSGTANTIQLDPATVIFPSYPKQFPLIKYTSWTNGVNNFVLASVPAWAPNATIVSNGVNASLDLVVPNDPRPVFASQPSPYSGSPGDNITSALAVTIDPNSVQPLGYQWYYVSGSSVTNLLTDGPGQSGTSTLTGSATANLQIGNAQTGDSGNYFVVVTNAFGTNSSSAVLVTISGTPIPPNVTGPAAQATTNGVTTLIVDAVSGSPVPTLRWQFNGVDLSDGPGPSGSSTVSGTTSSTLTIVNPQYPGDQGTYSLIAQNSAGKATNDTVLTVLVPPSISQQPANLVVTNTQGASFTVVAGGVPAPTYQWYKGSLANPISSAVNATAITATFTITNVAPADTATYFVVVQNPAGSVTSSNATLTVNSTMSPTAMKPANSASGISYDTPLYITFNFAPTVRAAGKIKIFNVTNSTTPVDTLDMNQGILQGRTIATEIFNTYPVITTGNTAAIYPHGGVMSSNQTYYVTIDDGVFADSTGAYFAGITDTNAWQFTTKVTGPLNPTNLVVVQDYSGDFATLQGAIDSLPANNVSGAMINVRDGVYTEVVEFKKTNIVVRGQSRGGTIIGYANNSNLNPSTHSRMAMKINANDIALDNLTVTNSTPQDLSQAEALMIESGAARFIVNNCNVDSYQDTILANISTSKAYFNHSLIQGDVDFIWGGGNLFFTNCEVRYLIRAANAAALGPNPSPGATDINSNGFSFVNCLLTTLPGANAADTVGRTRGITNGNTALINCFVSTNIGGWSSDALPTSSFRNWYFGCPNDLGAAVALSNGIPLSATDTNLTNASSATIWLYGWQPQLSPNIVTNPANQTVNAGATATFSVVATGIPDPTYQWLVNGTNINNATNASFSIPSTTTDNAGPYTVIVTTSSGTVTSAPATLTVNPPVNTPPVITFPVNGTDFPTNVGGNLVINCIATDADVPAQQLTFSLLSGPTGASITTSGQLTWRPTVAQAGSVNPVSVVVTDNGVPNLSATNNFTLTVNPIVAPNLGSSAINGNGQFTMSVDGQVGPDYTIQVSSNLLGGWTTLYTTNPTAMPFNVTDTNALAPQEFYRVLIGP